MAVTSAQLKTAIDQAALGGLKRVTFPDGTSQEFRDLDEMWTVYHRLKAQEEAGAADGGSFHPVTISRGGGC